MKEREKDETNNGYSYFAKDLQTEKTALTRNVEDHLSESNYFNDYE